MNTRLHLIVKGRVQGVFFRLYAKNTAKKLGITGWVRNNPNGTVEIVAEGTKSALETLLEKCRNGSVWSKVDEIEEKWGKATGEFKDVEIIY